MSHQQAHENFELSSSKHMWTQSAGASKDACIKDACRGVVCKTIPTLHPHYFGMSLVGSRPPSVSTVHEFSLQQSQTLSPHCVCVSTPSGSIYGKDHWCPIGMGSSTKVTCVTSLVPPSKHLTFVVHTQTHRHTHTCMLRILTYG